MPAFSKLATLVLLAASLVSASSHGEVHSHHERMLLQPGAKRTAPYIGKRDNSKNGMPYPETDVAPKQVPQAWTDKYNQAKTAGLIPDVQPAKANPAGPVIYPGSVKLSDVCNWEVDGCNLDSSITEAPDSVLAIGLDDGPTAAVTGLAKMLNEQNVTVTHFLIGSAVANNPNAMTELFKSTPTPHLGCHSWSHLQLPLFTDEEIVGDLGWCQQIIYDYTGVIPIYLRAPQGDVDIRVAAIAKYVFNMQVVMWNQDALDWCIQEDGQAAALDVCKGVTTDSIKQEYSGWMTNSSKAGVLFLGHEIRDSSLPLTQSLIEDAKKNGWKVGPVTLVNDKLPWYGNSADGSNPQPVDSLPLNKKPFDVSKGGQVVTLNSDYTAGAGKAASGAETGNQTASQKQSNSSGGSTTNTTSTGTATSTNTTGSQGGTTSGGTSSSSGSGSTTVPNGAAGFAADVVRVGVAATGAGIILAGLLVLG